MRRTIALAGATLAFAAAFAPLPSASAQCTDLSAIGGPKCAWICPSILIELTDEHVGYGFIRCTM